MAKQKDKKAQDRKLPQPGDFLNPGTENPLATAASDVTAASLGDIVRALKPPTAEQEAAAASNAAKQTFVQTDIPARAQFALFTPNTFKVPFGLGYLPNGFYLIVGETSGGKSMNAVALYFWLWSIRTTARYIPLAEPRSPESTSVLNADMATLITKLAASSEFTTDEKGNVYNALFLDSIGLAMRMYMPAERGKFGAMKEGMSPLDQTFVRDFQMWARSRAAVFGVVNENEVPFADELAGLCEGIVHSISASTFRIVFRAGRRTDITVTIPPEFVALAARALGYDSTQSSAAVGASTITSSTLMLR